MNKRFRRMADTDVKSIIADLDRWQCIAFHIRQKGLQVHEIDQPATEYTLTERETNNILRPFDKEVPSSGRI